jgi:hypothetical protein
MREVSERNDGIPSATSGLAFSELAQIGRDQLKRGPSSVSYNARMEMQNARNHGDGTSPGRAFLERVKTIRIWHEICPEDP